MPEPSKPTATWPTHHTRHKNHEVLQVSILAICAEAALPNYHGAFEGITL
ncbi:MAG: hypothetical protein NT111_00805 [Patescibacteria group bacterium]|nr:hypothetical protein [Patescibacteria group bacterium]